MRSSRLRSARCRLASERGQASVELVATLPAVLLTGLVAWQLAVAGQAAWLCANAARVAARADAVGEDAERAARSALPRRLERGLRVKDDGQGRIHVRLRIPLVAGAGQSPVTIGAAAGLGQG